MYFFSCAVQGLCWSLRLHLGPARCSVSMRFTFHRYNEARASRVLGRALGGICTEKCMYCTPLYALCIVFSVAAFCGSCALHTVQG